MNSQFHFAKSPFANCLAFDRLTLSVNEVPKIYESPMIIPFSLSVFYIFYYDIKFTKY